MEPQQHIETKLDNQNRIPGAILIGSLIIAVSVIYSGTIIASRGQVTQVAGIDQAGQALNGAAAAVNIANINTQNEPFYGNADAPVTLAYWSDYQCPFCKKFEVETMPNIISNYVDKGKVKIVFKDFQFLGPDSSIAALYARAVWNEYPQQFFAWREAMFAKQDDENKGFGTEADIASLTQTISGIDVTHVKQSIAAHKDEYQKAIDADKAEASKIGIQGTPGFVVGKEALSGAMPYEQFSAKIEALLK